MGIAGIFILILDLPLFRVHCVHLLSFQECSDSKHFRKCIIIYLEMPQYRGLTDSLAEQRVQMKPLGLPPKSSKDTEAKGRNQIRSLDIQN